MKAYLLIVIGLLLLGLSTAKVVGMIDLQVEGTDKPPMFFVRQVIYAMVFLGFGVSATWTGWKNRGRVNGDHGSDDQ